MKVDSFSIGLNRPGETVRKWESGKIFPNGIQPLGCLSVFSMKPLSIILAGKRFGSSQIDLVVFLVPG